MVVMEERSNQLPSLVGGAAVHGQSSKRLLPRALSATCSLLSTRRWCQPRKGGAQGQNRRLTSDGDRPPTPCITCINCITKFCHKSPQ
jgi:hypothetical protein